MSEARRGYVVGRALLAASETGFSGGVLFVGRSVGRSVGRWADECVRGLGSGEVLCCVVLLHVLNG